MTILHIEVKSTIMKRLNKMQKESGIVYSKFVDEVLFRGMNDIDWQNMEAESWERQWQERKDEREAQDNV